MAKTQSEVLNDLISTCRDSQEGYSKAAKGVHSDDLRRVLMNIFEERGRFVEELQALVRSGSDGHVADRPHGGGPMHRGWSELEARIRPKGDPEILVNCLDGDATTLDHYDHAVASGLLTDDARQVAERQLQRVRASLEELRSRQTEHQHA
jgi:uncharacterized protein (TIGR02284 family)